MFKEQDYWEAPDLEARVKKDFQTSKGLPPGWHLSLKLAVEQMEKGEVPGEYDLAVLLLAPELMSVAVKIVETKKTAKVV